VVGWILTAMTLAVTFLPVRTGAHTPSETYFALSVSGTNLTGRWDVALRDLHQGMSLGLEDLKRVAPAELQEREEALVLDIVAGVGLRADGTPLKLIITDYTTLSLNGLDYARLLFNASGILTSPDVIEIDARILFRIDTNMHGLLRLEHNSRTDVIAFNHDRAAYRFELGQPGGLWARWLSFVWEGVWHIWIGFDHMLFLVALLLPAVLKREANRWTGVDRFRDAMINVVKIVTAFTIAHSITLSLSVLNIVRLPTRLVESAIAVSVALAALSNFWPRLCDKGWLVALGFGLIHGFGFANVLVELELTGGILALALVGFNVGVELGQLMVVIAFVPLAFQMRRSWLYHTITLKVGSAVVALIAVAWVVERLFGHRLIAP
jgi:hypothetical protein